MCFFVEFKRFNHTTIIVNYVTFTIIIVKKTSFRRKTLINWVFYRHFKQTTYVWQAFHSINFPTRFIKPIKSSGGRYN